jgi:hypothetical protein
MGYDNISLIIQQQCYPYYGFCFMNVASFDVSENEDLKRFNVHFCL